MAEQATLAEPLKKNPFKEETWTTEPPTQVAEAVNGAGTKTEPEPVKETPAETPIAEQPKPEEPKVFTTEPSIKFANEQSERFFNLLKDGKEDEVFNYLSEKKRLEKLDEMEAADLIKLSLKAENPEFNDNDIEDLFNDKFAIGDKPVQRDDQTDEDFADEAGKWQKESEKLSRRIARNAKAAKAELAKKRAELVLPDIPKPAPEAIKPPEPSQEELAAIAKARENYLASLEVGINEFKGYKTKYKDEEVEYEVAYEIPEEKKAPLKNGLSSWDYNEYFASRWLDEKGNVNAAKMSADKYLLENQEEVFAAIANQSGANRLVEHIKATKNIDFSGQRISGAGKPSEIDLQIKAAKHAYSQ